MVEETLNEILDMGVVCPLYCFYCHENETDYCSYGNFLKCDEYISKAKEITERVNTIFEEIRHLK